VREPGDLCGLSAIVGAKIMMFLVDIPYYARNPGEIFSWPACRPAAFSMAA
jgi:hypothetical protein